MGKLEKLDAEVVSVVPDNIKVQVKNIETYAEAEDRLRIGSYLRVSDHTDCAILATIERFQIELVNGERKYILDARPIGFLDAEGNFSRGGANLAIPPTKVEPATSEEIEAIYSQSDCDRRFTFSKLSQDDKVNVFVDGDRLFNKHLAIVGSTGSGKSCAVSAIIQQACAQKTFESDALNNAHVVIFDIHGEYLTAFPDSQTLNVTNLRLPYWLLNGEELEELLVESGENQAYNQVSLLRSLVTLNKTVTNELDKCSFDKPVKFDILQVTNALVNLSRETRNSKDPRYITLAGGSKTFDNEAKKLEFYFEKVHEFEEGKQGSISKGTYNDGTLEKFINRLTSKVEDKRLDFLFSQSATSTSLNEVLKSLLGYGQPQANVTTIDMSGVPFEVLSVSVSLISRLLFDYSFQFRAAFYGCETPLFLIYEEAHKYVPKTEAAKYGASRASIERIAKEGRKYGISLAIVSQRPSEVADTIFSQCNNFICMRLTNPKDQNSVKRLLPDSLGAVVDRLPVLQSGEAIVIGDAIVMPATVRITRCDPSPSSSDVPFLELWRREWFQVNFDALASKWMEQT